MLRNTVLPVLAGALMLWTTQPAQAIVYLEEGGRVTVEAEFFSNRTTSGAGGLWTVKPGENSGTAIVDGGPIVSNFRGTGYVQTLPDALNPGGPNVDPLVEYQIQITNPGTYRLYVRWDGNNTNGTTRGQSDSLFVDIKEQKDGGGGAIADWYELTESSPARQSRPEKAGQVREGGRGDHRGKEHGRDVEDLDGDDPDHAALDHRQRGWIRHRGEHLLPIARARHQGQAARGEGLQKSPKHRGGL